MVLSLIVRLFVHFVLTVIRRRKNPKTSLSGPSSISRSEIGRTLSKWLKCLQEAASSSNKLPGPLRALVLPAPITGRPILGHIIPEELTIGCLTTSGTAGDSVVGKIISI